MIPHDRMFRVLVLGGVALVGGTACGARASVSTDAGEADAEFPFEGASSASSSGGSSSGSSSGGSSSSSSGSSSGGWSAGPDAGMVNDAASEAGPDAAGSTLCPQYDIEVGDACFPGEAPA
jgi:hypothetical protein